MLFNNAIDELVDYVTEDSIGVRDLKDKIKDYAESFGKVYRIKENLKLSIKTYLLNRGWKCKGIIGSESFFHEDVVFDKNLSSQTERTNPELTLLEAFLVESEKITVIEPGTLSKLKDDYGLY